MQIQNFMGAQNTSFFPMMQNDVNSAKESAFSALLGNFTGTNRTPGKTLMFEAKAEIKVVEKNMEADGKNNLLNSVNTNEAAKTTENADVIKKDAVTESAEIVNNNAEAAEETVDTEDFEKVCMVMVQITVTVTEILQISPEELSNAMDTLGMSMQDLLNPDSLKDLFSFIKLDGDMTQLVTNETVLETFNILTTEVSNILEENNISSEFITTLLDKMPESFKETFFMNLTDDVKLAAPKTEGTEETPVTDETEGFAADVKAEKTLTIKAPEKDTKADMNSTDLKGNKSKTVETEKTDLFDKFVNNMAEAFKERLEAVTDSYVQVQDIREIGAQILEQIKINITENVQSLEMKLTPEHLGKVSITVENNNGVMTARFTTENEVTKNAIESGLQQFKEALNEQGIKVEHVEVTISNFEFNKNKESESQNSGSNSGEKRKRSFSIEETDDRTESADLRAESYIDNGTSTVSFVA